MSEQLPPVDAGLRSQLERRAAGRVPPGLLDEVMSSVDMAPTPAPVVAFAFVRRNRRISGALVGLAAVVALLAALVAVPALQPKPDTAAYPGYPSDRALTTPELSALMAGPALATNTALIAEVTITASPDVCPMNRYPTLGVVEGMKSQVCVMASSVTYDLKPGWPGHGVFAFRYLGPGYLGLLGQITAAPSRLAYHVVDDWPAVGKTFVVEGWLGATPYVQWGCPAGGMSAGDVLSPGGGECGFKSWLADSATADAIASPAASAIADQSMDPIALYGNARLVQAGGMRQYDSVDASQPVHGTYVVRSSVGACPGDPPTSSRGCSYWLVLAKLADIRVPGPSQTPTVAATASHSPSGYPADRALTAAELSSLVSGSGLGPNAAVVAGVTIDVRTDACQLSGYRTVGVVAGADPQVCVVQRSDSALPQPVTLSGTYAFRYMAPGVVGLLDSLTPASGSRLAFSANEAWPELGKSFLVTGWLSGYPHSCPATPEASAEVLSPPGEIVDRCTWNRLSSESTAAWPNDPSRASGLVAAESALAIDSIDDMTAPVFGTWVVRSSDTPCPNASAGFTDACGSPMVLARVADVSLPGPTPQPSPTPSPPTTPIPEQTPTPSPDNSYPGSRAMTAAELDQYLQTGLGIKDQVVVAQVSFGRMGGCPSLPPYQPIGLLAGMSSDVCVVGIGDGKPEHTPAASGPYAFRVLDSRTLGFMANVSAAVPEQLAYTPAAAWPAGATVLVSGWLVASSGPFSCPMEGEIVPAPLDPGGTSCGPTWLTAQRVAGPLASPPPTGDPGFRGVAIPDYPVLGGNLLGSDGAATYGTYLVRDEKQCNWTFPSPPPGEDNTWDKLCGWQVVARVDPVVLPQSTPAPSPTPVASAGGTGPTAFWGSGNRPLTGAEFPTLWATDPQHLAGRVVVVKGPVPAGFSCWSAGAADPTARVCHVAVSQQTIAPEGYWAVRVGADGELAVIGQLESTSSTFLSTVPGVNSSASLKTGDLVAVDAWLHFDGLRCDVRLPTGNPPCSPSWLADSGDMNSMYVQGNAYESWGSSGTNLSPTRAIYLVQTCTGCNNHTIVARLEQVPANP